jgi:hypothetical protein
MENVKICKSKSINNAAIKYATLTKACEGQMSGFVEIF